MGRIVPAVPLNAARRVEGDLAGLDWDALRPELAGLSRVLAYNTASIDTSGMAAALQVLADNTAFTLRERDDLAGAVGQISRRTDHPHRQGREDQLGTPLRVLPQQGRALPVRRRTGAGRGA